MVAHEVRIVGDRLEFFGRMNGPIGAATQPENGFYLFGVDRGLGTPRFLRRLALIGPNVTWDLVVRVNRDGTGHINHPLTGLRTTLDPADIRITGNELTASVALSDLTPAPAELRPPEQWTYNLWPRIGEIRGQNQFVSDLPDDATRRTARQRSGPVHLRVRDRAHHRLERDRRGSADPVRDGGPHGLDAGSRVHRAGDRQQRRYGNFLYAADFKNNEIDVFDRTYAPTTLAGSFVDPGIPDDYSAFNIWKVGGKLYVAYAQQLDGDAVPDGGSGFVSVFDTNGNFLNRLISEDHLNMPWGLALAPGNFGEFSNAVLVGNHGDGMINAYDSTTGDFLGPLARRERRTCRDRRAVWTALRQRHRVR